MNGPQCIECGGFNECNHGMEPPTEYVDCPICDGDGCNTCDDGQVEAHLVAAVMRDYRDEQAVEAVRS